MQNGENGFGCDSWKQQSTTNLVFSGPGHDQLLTEKKLHEWSQFSLQWITSCSFLFAIDNEWPLKDSNGLQHEQNMVGSHASCTQHNVL